MDKTFEMERYNITWTRVSEELNITDRTLARWRKKPTQRQAKLIESAVDDLLEREKRRRNKN